MSKKKVVGIIASSIVGGTAVATWIMKKKAKKTTYKAENIEAIPTRKMGFYEKYIKRAIDIVCASAAIICFSPIYIGVAILVRFKLGSPVLFTQDRPGLIGEDGKETIFKMYKFRTMTDERDENGDLLPDEVRLTSFGKWLRSTSLDELPEAFNILNGTLSVCGPRPQLVRDMVFMTDEQRMRHTAKPGLSGLAQVNGRNAISWEDKINWDLKYIEKVSFLEDLKIILSTVKKAFIKQEGITQDDMATAEDFGDYLLRTEKVDKENYNKKQLQATMILSGSDRIEREAGLVSIIMPSYNTASFIEETIQSVLNQTYTNWELIIVNDCSTDKTEQIIKKYQEQDQRIRLCSLIKNKGVANARNTAIKNAVGRYLAFLDSDDMWLPEKLEKQINFMKKNGYSFTYHSYRIFIVSDNSLGKIINVPIQVNYEKLLQGNSTGSCLSTCIDRNIVEEIYMPNDKHEDFICWLNVLKKYGIVGYGISECLAYYRVGKKSVSSNKFKSAYWTWNVYRTSQRLSIVQSIYYMFFYIKSGLKKWS